MMRAVEDSFLDLEQHRQLLEKSIERLQKSLQHWQTWEVEYEGLKEEILSLGPALSHDQLIVIGLQFDGKLVTQTEIEDILGVKTSRSTDQVTNILSRRIDYVSQNVKTLEKQLDTAENRLATIMVNGNSDVRNEDDLPLTEIIEELDEDGNVVSSRTETQGSARGQLLEVLEKARVKNLPGLEEEQKSGKLSTGSNAPDGSVKDRTVSIASERPKKSVQFAEGAKEEPLDKSKSAKVNVITNCPRQQNSVPAEPPAMPSNESAEDAALRQEMLRYGASEVGAVVAELYLEDGSDFTDDNEEYDDSDVSSTEDEDKYGRSTEKVVDEEMRLRMIKLEERLGLRKVEKVRPNPNVDIEVESLSETHNTFEASKAPSSVKETKEVRFAEELDISIVKSETTPSEPPKQKNMVPSKPPVSDIVERAPPTQKTEMVPMPLERMSQFKSARAAQLPIKTSVEGTDNVPLDLQPLFNPSVTSAPKTPPAPSKPAGKPLADTIIEREILETTLLEPNSLDLALLQQETVTEFYRRHNRLIQKQGGFVKDLELEKGIISLTEEGGPKKMSRFKAARLARS